MRWINRVISDIDSRCHVIFWDHFHPDRKRHLLIRKLRFVDGWFTRMESISPHAGVFLKRAEAAVYVNYPPRRRLAQNENLGSGQLSAQAFAEYLARNEDGQREAL